MATGAKQPFRDQMRLTPQITVLEGTITIGAAGAVTTQSESGAVGGIVAGITWTKNAAAGRYDGTLHRGYKRVTNGAANIITPTAGSVPVVTDGNLAFVQGITAANVAGTTPIAGATAAVPCIQCVTSNGVATAANPKSGDIISWRITVSDA